MMVIVILDEFFIQLNDLLISFLIKVIDFIVFILDKFHNKENLENGMDSNNENDSKDEINLTNERIFMIKRINAKMRSFKNFATTLNDMGRFYAEKMQIF